MTVTDDGKGCRFPLWAHDAAPTHEFCSAPRVGLSAYCLRHEAVCYVHAPSEQSIRMRKYWDERRARRGAA